MPPFFPTNPKHTTMWTADEWPPELAEWKQDKATHVRLSPPKTKVGATEDVYPVGMCPVLASSVLADGRVVIVLGAP